jgi:p-methyltransferase
MRAADFDLEGVAHNWKHRTMTSREALRAVDRMFYEVKAAAWMPVNGLDFWGVPYLLGKGLEPAEILGFLRRAKPLTAIYAADGAPPAPIVDAGLDPAASFQDYCASLPLSAGRYSFDPALVS